MHSLTKQMGGARAHMRSRAKPLPARLHAQGAPPNSTRHAAREKRTPRKPATPVLACSGTTARSTMRCSQCLPRA